MSMRSSFRALLFAAVLVLSAALASAGDETTFIPLFSWADGSSAHIEISRAGERSKAVPVLILPDVSFPQVSGTDGKGSVPPGGRSAGTDGVKGKERADAGGFDASLRSLFVREGQEGICLGNAFDLAGDIQEAVKKFRKRHPSEGLAASGNDDDADRLRPSGKESPAENQGTYHAVDIPSRVH